MVQRRRDPAERVLNLLTLLHNSSQPMTRDEIVQKMSRGMTPYPENDEAQRQLFNADRRVISRDLGIRVQQKIESGSQAGQTVYWIAEEDMCIPELRLTDVEISILSVALAALRVSVPTAGEALMKLDGHIPDRAFLDMNMPIPLVVVRLTEGAQRRLVVRFRIGEAEHSLEPWRVLFDKGTWFVIGSEHHSGHLVIHKCSQIQGEVRLDSETPTVHPRQTLDVRTVKRLVHGASEPEYLATVIVDSQANPLTTWDRRVVGTEPLDDGRIRVTVTVDDEARFRGWVLGFGTHAVVEGPPDVRARFVSWLEQLSQTRSSPLPVPSRPTPVGVRPGPRPVGERLQRLVSILPWLIRSGSIPVEELAELVGVSPEALVIDLQFASNCGIPPYTADVLFQFWVEDGFVHVYGHTQARGFIRRARGLITRGVRLTPRQATAVGLALAGLEAVKRVDSRGSDPINSLRKKIESAIGELPVDVRLEDAPLLGRVSRLVEESREAVIEYVNNEDELSTRRIHPLHVFVDRGEAYLIADDLGLPEGERERKFRIDRILEIDETGVTFVPREVSWDGTWTFRGEVKEAVLYLAPGNEWMLDRVAVKDHVVNADGSLFVWLDVASRGWLGRLLTRCGPRSCVVSPPELADSGTHFSQSIRRLYG
jgi:predicted DNA-binding transcriptional regulator YafY